MVKRVEIVVLLHGIGRTARSMNRVARFLDAHGYKVLNITYPSRRINVAAIADWLNNHHLTSDFWRNDDIESVHFVTHSMGGLVARCYLAKHRSIIPENKLGRVVMLGPPNQGSEIADILQGLKLFKLLFGPAGENLTTQSNINLNHAVFYEAGIIAGSSRWLYPLSSLLIRGPSDGRVAVERTKIDGMKDHITINTSHSLMMYRNDVMKYILTFLQQGRFDNV